jgi:hypothetical protein
LPLSDRDEVIAPGKRPGDRSGPVVNFDLEAGQFAFDLAAEVRTPLISEPTTSSVSWL